jgi:casein kinase 1
MGIPFCGTAEFTSLAAHNGLGHSRKDDLESIGLVLIWFMRGGDLPWYDKYGEDRHKKIAQCMNKTNLSVLCSDCPKQMKTFIKYCRDLDFEEQPDYKYLEGLLDQVIK